MAKSPKKTKGPAAKGRHAAAKPLRAEPKPPRSVGSKPQRPLREKLMTIKPSGEKDHSFFDLVHEVARQVPKGRVTSYGAIAAALGTRLSARMVGWAMNACHLAKPAVPAHRVVNSKGLLTGRHHFDPPEKMQMLLEKEGVAVRNDQVVDFGRLFWDPSKEL
jgi:methylated-DNA-protein-cysteine methyltransferase related protein